MLDNLSMAASRQWATRPPEERFVNLNELHKVMAISRRRSRATVVSNRQLQVAPSKDGDLRGLQIAGPVGHDANFTHWSFSQLCTRVSAPAGFLRSLPSPLAADCLNYQLKFANEPEDVGILLRRDDNDINLAAATGPRYGRVWNADVTQALLDRVGDGVTGTWRVPGEFGKAVQVTRQNTTLYGSDRDMFVFLADEENRIEVPDRRNGQSGTMARGFFVWNSEVGAATLGIAFFLFDYVCQNRIVWGMQNAVTKRIRHTVSAPDRWAETVLPMLEDYSQSSAAPTVAALEHARQAKIDTDVQDWLAKRFTPTMAKAIVAVHEEEEGRPIETVRDAVTGATAYARTIPYQAERVALETQAGDLLTLVA